MTISQIRNELFEEYKKYYFLENYLKEITIKFEKGETLTPEDFFAIVIWKANRKHWHPKGKFLAIDQL